MLAEGMASLLIKPPLLGISCVPPSIWFSWCGVAAHAETVTAKTIPPTQAIAPFTLPCRARVRMFLPFQPLVIQPKTSDDIPRPCAIEASTSFAVLPAIVGYGP